MENTAGSGAKMQQSWPPLSEAAAPTSYYSTNPHQAYVYSDSNYSLYYPQPQIPNLNLHYQQSYSNTNGLNSLVHPPGVDPNPATYVHDGHQLGLLHAYPQRPVSVPLAEAVAIAYHQDNNFANVQMNSYSNGVTIQPTVAANRKSTLSRRKSIGPKINNSSNNAPKKVKVVQSAWCEVCKLDCNNKNVLDAHKLGKKHKKNLEKLIAASIQVNVPAPVPSQVPTPASGNTLIGPKKNPSGKKAKRKAAGKEDLETKKKKMLEGRAAAEAVRTCEVCKVNCNNKNVLDEHKLGKKHKRNLEKLIGASIQVNVPAPAPAPVSGNTLIGPQENPSRKKAKRKAAGKEDLETKKKKVLEGGAAVEDVRMCDICKVVCNSETIFKYHLAGKKHASMMNKHESTSTIASSSAGIASTSTIASIAAT